MVIVNSNRSVFYREESLWESIACCSRLLAKPTISLNKACFSDSGHFS